MTISGVGMTYLIGLGWGRQIIVTWGGNVFPLPMTGEVTGAEGR